MSDSIYPDETAHDEPSHLVLRCLQKPIIIAYSSERVQLGILVLKLYYVHFTTFVLNECQTVYTLIR